MSGDGLDYDFLIGDALRNVMKTALAQVAKNGLPGGHYFYITFRTGDPGVILPEYLRATHTAEMTIALQHQFWDLIVEEKKFQVTLHFNKIPETLEIPFSSVTLFADPPAQFNLQFGTNTPGKAVDHNITDPLSPFPESVPAPGPKAPQNTRDAEVISLDAFRNPKETA